MTSKELCEQRIRGSAVGLVLQILKFKEEYGVDMMEEIIQYLKERLSPSSG